MVYPGTLFEIWQGNAIIYAQETTALDRPGRCFAIEANPGDKIVIPPGWAHCVINSNPETRMVFGAWCDRQYGFVYDGVRAHRGLAWFPLLGSDGIEWQRNSSYAASRAESAGPRAPIRNSAYRTRSPIYEQFARDPGRMQWVSEPSLAGSPLGNF
jgi:glucose-6-phosphate isomerase